MDNADNISTDIDFDAILDKVDEIIGQRSLLSNDDLRAKYNTFAEAYPALFDKCLEPKFDRSHLVCALQLLKKVQAKEMPKRDADIAFGRATMACHATSFI